MVTFRHFHKSYFWPSFTLLFASVYILAGEAQVGHGLFATAIVKTLTTTTSLQFILFIFYDAARPSRTTSALMVLLLVVTPV